MGNYKRLLVKIESYAYYYAVDENDRYQCGAELPEGWGNDIQDEHDMTATVVEIDRDYHLNDAMIKHMKSDMYDVYCDMTVAVSEELERQDIKLNRNIALESVLDNANEPGEDI